MTDEQKKVIYAQLRLDGHKVYPCYEWGYTKDCTRELTGVIFHSKEEEDSYFDACTYHLPLLRSLLKEDTDTEFQEIKL